MWVLIFVFFQTGTGFTVPGFSSLEKCGDAGTQLLRQLQPSVQMGAKIMWTCQQVN